MSMSSNDDLPEGVPAARPPPAPRPCAFARRRVPPEPVSPTLGRPLGDFDVVWARQRSHPFWPAQIVPALDYADDDNHAVMHEVRMGRPGPSYAYLFVRFFGEASVAWIRRKDCLLDFACPTAMARYGPVEGGRGRRSSPEFQAAVAEAAEVLEVRIELGLQVPVVQNGGT